MSESEKRRLFAALVAAVTNGQEAEGWGVPEEQPADDVFGFQQMPWCPHLGHCPPGEFQLHLCTDQKQPSGVASVRRFGRGGALSIWSPCQTVYGVNGGILANGYYAPPVDPADPAAVREFVRWVLSNNWHEPPIPGTQSRSEYERLVRRRRFGM